MRPRADVLREISDLRRLLDLYQSDPPRPGSGAHLMWRQLQRRQWELFLELDLHDDVEVAGQVAMAKSAAADLPDEHLRAKKKTNGVERAKSAEPGKLRYVAIVVVVAVAIGLVVVGLVGFVRALANGDMVALVVGGVSAVVSVLLIWRLERR